jgi:uncharacterized protein (TIGR03905 family)
MKTTYMTHGTCADRIDLEIEDGVIRAVRFHDGCSGNLQGISKLVVGANARETMERLRGIRCGRRGTSCPDQLALAIEGALASGEV